MICQVVQEREQPQLLDTVHRVSAGRHCLGGAGSNVAQPFRGIAADQVEAAVSGGMVGPGDMVVFVDGPRLGIATCAVGGGQGLALAAERVG